MKYLILALLLFLIFWYYKKKRVSAKTKKKAMEVEMKSCALCGIYFSPSEGHLLKREEKDLPFCSEKCIKEYLEKKEGKP